MSESKVCPCACHESGWMRCEDCVSEHTGEPQAGHDGVAQPPRKHRTWTELKSEMDGVAQPSPPYDPEGVNAAIREQLRKQGESAQGGIIRGLEDMKDGRTKPIEEIREKLLQDSHSKEVGESAQGGNDAGGTWPEGCVQRAFVEGAKWWEWHQTKATMWPSDRDLAESEAVRIYGEVASPSAALSLLEKLVKVVDAYLGNCECPEGDPCRICIDANTASDEWARLYSPEAYGSRPVAELITVRIIDKGRQEEFACVNVGEESGYRPPEGVEVISRKPLYLSDSGSQPTAPLTEEKK